MIDPGGPDLWQQAPWRAGLFAWADAALAAQRQAPSGGWVLHRLKPWAVVFRSQAPAGRWWLKAAGPGTAFEVGLYAQLARAGRREVLAPLALAPERGWLLLPEGPAPLATRGWGLEPALRQALPQYAALQRALAARGPELLATGLPDRSPPRLPQALDEALRQAKASLEAAPTEAGWALWREVDALRGQAKTWAEALACSPIPCSVDHHDLHGGNLLPEGPPEALRFTFLDWGDAVWGHPFMSLLMALGAPKAAWGCADEDPRLLRLQDAYLEVWSDLAPRQELLEAVGLATRLALICRSLAWQRALAGGGEEARQHAGVPLQILGHLRHPPRYLMA